MLRLFKLFPGAESREKILKLIKIANMKSAAKKNALLDYYCEGKSQQMCSILYDLSQPTISAAAKRLNEIYKLSCEVVYEDKARSSH